MQQRTFVTFPFTDTQQRIKMQMLNWASRFNIFAFLDNQDYDLPLHSFDGVLAAGVIDAVEASAGHAFDKLQAFADKCRDWLFGHFGYELVRETEPFQRPIDTRPHPIGFPDLYFFVPEVIIELRGASLRIGSLRGDHEKIFKDIMACPGETTPSNEVPVLQPVFSKEEYLEAVKALQRHILRGDAYEVNFCQEFFSRSAKIHPLAVWEALCHSSPNPFSAFYRLNEKFLLCASPERYLRREGNMVISQPIKGTAARIPEDAKADQAAAEKLRASAKDQSENVMVVDLVRNDLAKICLPGTVRVRELFGIYSFPQVFQMTSSIEGILPPGMGFVEPIKATFPMGSMTGAPKRRVAELIDRYERGSRGLFSGAVGYISPEGDFDFNVVIRSLFYNRETQYLSYLVGSGITFYSDPELEYEECLMKAEGIKKALGIAQRG